MKQNIKKIIKSNKKYLVWHWILFSLIALGLLSKIILVFQIVNDGKLWLIIIGLLLVSFLSIIALISLGLYKKWAYWLILIGFSLSGFSSNISLDGALINFLLAAPIPIYLLYKISQENKSIHSTPPNQTNSN